MCLLAKIRNYSERSKLLSFFIGRQNDLAEEICNTTDAVLLNIAELKD